MDLYLLQGLVEAPLPTSSSLVGEAIAKLGSILQQAVLTDDAPSSAYFKLWKYFSLITLLRTPRLKQYHDFCIIVIVSACPSVLIREYEDDI